MTTSTHFRLTRATMAHYMVRRAEYRYTPFALERLPLGEGFLPTGFSGLTRKPESEGIL